MRGIPLTPSSNPNRDCPLLSFILVLLARRAGKLVTRAEIQEALWGEDEFVEFDHAINTAVKKIRIALDDEAENPRFIETLPRKGYRFIAAVEYVSPDVLADTGSPAGPSAGGETKDPPGAVGNIDPLPTPRNPREPKRLYCPPALPGLYSS